MTGTLQNIALSSGKFDHEKLFWSDQLSGVIRFELSPDYQRIKNMKRNHEKIQYSFSPETVARVDKVAHNSDPAVYMIVMAAFQYLLSLYTTSEDVVVLLPIPLQKNVQELLNNILALRTLVNSEMTFKELLMTVRKNIVAVNENLNYPLVKVAEDLGIAVSRERYPFSDLFISLDSIHDQSYLKSRFEVAFLLTRQDGKLDCSVEYDTNLYHEKSIQYMIEQLEIILQVALANLDVPLKELDFLSESERQSILIHFNQTMVDYPKERFVYQLVEEQVQKNPDRIALCFADQQMTYLEVNEKANQLARFLREQGVKPDQLVGIIAHRSFEMVIGILSVLKAGGAYLPIDPDYPSERIAFMAEDSNIELLLTQTALKDKIQLNIRVIDLDDQSLYTGATSNLESVNRPDHLVYVIYTSGSTGKPKGVMIEHRGLMNYISWGSKVYVPEGEDCAFPLYSSLSFDLTVTSVYLPLVTGNKLMIYDQAENDILISKIIRDDKVQVIKLTPAHLKVIQQMEFTTSGVQKFIVGGEELKSSLADAIYEKFGRHVEIFNEYGPTETVVGCMIYRYSPANRERISVPIGVPADNVQIYLLDENCKPVIRGVPGEIYIAGDGVARGYLQRDDLTQERFVANPFVQGKRMYRTGDLARRLYDGNIEFLGRIDNQVKLYGYRVELKEIENQLLQNPLVKEVVVVDRVDSTGDKYLAAYLVIDKEQVENVDSRLVTELRAYTASKLPEYMVPTYFIFIDQIPLTINGKVDRRALPEPDHSMYAETEYVPPRTKVEAELAEIWTKVLGVENVGIRDNFFILGGQSLKAMMIATKIMQSLNVSISMRKIFENPTIEELAILVNDGENMAYSSIIPVPEQEFYPVSSAQKRLYALVQRDEDQIAYNIPYVLQLDPEIDFQRVEQTLGKLIERHEVLRTSFTMKDNQVVQVVHDDAELEITYLQANEEDFLALIKNNIRPFDLSKAPLLHVGLIESANSRVLVLDVHHIIFDGVSMEIMMGEFWRLYKGEELPPLPIQYKDFAVWQNEFLQSDALEGQKKYWLDKFSDEIPVLNLPTDFPRPAILDFKGGHYTFSIDRQWTEALKELSVTYDGTLNMALLSAYYILLAKYSGQEDILIGTPNSGRHHVGLETVIGMFVNTLVLRARPDAEKDCTQFFAEVKNETLQSYEHQDYQFEMLVEALGLTREMSRNPLFDTLFVMQNMSDRVAESSQFADIGFDISKFDLSLTAIEVSEGLQFTFEYRSQLFTPQTIERMAGHYMNILQEFAKNPGTRIADIDILSAEERDVLLNELNRPEIIAHTETIPQAFQVVAEKFADKPALVKDGLTVSYEELDHRSNQLAIWLQAKGIKDEQVVGIVADRSIEMIVGILGVLKAGGAYLSLDMGYPEERITYMLEDSHVQLLLARAPELKVNFSGEIVDLSNLVIYQSESTGELEKAGHPEQLAYLIYTSGSTGKPKGVLLEHKGIVSLATYFQQEMGIVHTDHIVQFASGSFDASVWEIYMALLTGATLHLLDQNVIDSYDGFADFINTSQITVATLPPVYLRNLHPEQCVSLRKVITAGSKTDFDLVNRWKDKISYINAYGPTEGTICATWWEATGTMEDYVSVPIGKPIYNTKVYILNPTGQLVPIGVPGELCIAGIGIARGYLNLPELTEEKFVDNSFSLNSLDKKLYHTGDLARWLPDGNIEFLGRIDNQVKIRGHRIEPDEIESTLKHHGQVKEAIVVDYKDKALESYLCAYFTSDEQDVEQELREYLKNTLPNYMIPTYIIQLPEMPLTNSGKIDRHALPTPEDLVQNRVEYVPPANELEEQLVEIFKDVFGVEQIGVTHNFFELGGDSIKAMKVISIVGNLGYYCQVKDLIMNPTIEGFAKRIEKRDDILQDEQGLVSGDVFLSPIQKRVFTLGSYDKQHHHGCPFLLELKQDIDIPVLQKVLGKLMEHHDALRLNYDPERDICYENNSYLEKIIEIPVYDLSKSLLMIQNRKIAEYGTELMSSLHLEDEPYVKACIFDLGKRGKRLLIVVHHLVLDPASGTIFMEDFKEFLTQLVETGEIVPPKKTTSFKSWSAAVTNYAKSQELLAERPYWEEVLTTSFALPQDFDKGPYYFNMSDRVVASLTEEETVQLLTEVNHAYNTETSQLLITAMALTLSHFTGHKEVIFEIENNGRQGMDTNFDLSRTVGWFTAIYPAKFDFRHCEGLGEQILHVKSRLREIPDHGIGYGILKYLTEESLPEIDFRNTAVFNYIGQVEPGLRNPYFQGATEYSGDLTHPEISMIANLTAGCVVSDGEFRVWFTYSKNKYQRKTIKKLVNDYLDVLRQIINHCMNV